MDSVFILRQNSETKKALEIFGKFEPASMFKNIKRADNYHCLPTITSYIVHHKLCRYY